MINIEFKGILAKRLGEKWNLQVSSVLEIFQAIEANNSEVNNLFVDLQNFCTHFIVFINGKIMPPHLLNSRILKTNSEVKIVPVVQGGGVTLAMFLIGLAFSALSMILAKSMSPKSPRDVSTSSAVLGQVRNVVNRDIVVPLGYGRMRVGSAVVSNNIFATYDGRLYANDQNEESFMKKTLDENFDTIFDEFEIQAGWLENLTYSSSQS